MESNIEQNQPEEPDENQTTPAASGSLSSPDGIGAETASAQISQPEPETQPAPPSAAEQATQHLDQLESGPAEESVMINPLEMTWEDMQVPEPQTVQPYVSVIVAVRNEEGFVTRCLQALAAQDYPRERFEVIVVDGDSTDGTAREVREMVLAYGVPDVFKTNPQKTTAAGRNIGLSTSGGQVVVFVDGHTRVDPSFISAGVQALIESGADAVGGPIRTRGHGTVGRAIALAMASPFGVGGASFRTLGESAADARPIWAETVPFGAYRREVFMHLGGFAEDVEYGEDDEFNYRLRENGGRIRLSPAIRTVYYSRDSLGGLLRQYWNYGQAKVEVLRRHPRRTRPHHLAPAALIMAIGGGAILGLFKRKFWLLSILAGGSYATANAIVSLRIGSDGNKQETRYLPLAFAAMHFGAGAGILTGLWRLLSGSLSHNDDKRS